MQIHPKISVLLPVYNCELYIKETIDSVLNQTFADFELIVIDDCSTDQTVSVIKEFSDTRIRLIEKQVNSGLINSLNLGISIAKGEYIARMDGDDICLPERFAKQVAFLDKNPNIILCGTAYQTFGAIEKVIRHPLSHKKIAAQLCVHSVFGHPTVMGKKAIFEQHNYNDDFKNVEDYELWSRLIFEGEVANLDEILLFYRVHENQVSTIHNDVQQQRSIDIRLSLFKKTGYDVILFSDTFVKKMLYLGSYFTVAEFSLFLKWLKEISALNQTTKVYAAPEFENVLTGLRRDLIYRIFFHSNFCKIDKQWRIQAFNKLSFSDKVYVLKLKIKEKSKF